jgi:hypothetical protein
MTKLYPIDQIYHAERPKTEAEQRAVDRVNAEFAAAGAELWRACAASWQSLRQAALRARRHRKPRTQWHQPSPLHSGGTTPRIPPQLRGTETSLRAAPGEHAELCRTVC